MKNSGTESILVAKWNGFDKGLTLELIGRGKLTLTSPGWRLPTRAGPLSLLFPVLPLGQTVLIDDNPYQIVGLVKDAQMRSAIEGSLPVAYVPFWQDKTLLEARMCIRVAGDPATALPMVRKAIASIDPEVPVTEAMPLMDQVRGAYTDARVASAVLSCAALLAGGQCTWTRWWRRDTNDHSSRHPVNKAKDKDGGRLQDGRLQGELKPGGTYNLPRHADTSD